MALPPDKKIPGTEKLSKAASDLANKADDAAQKAAAAGSSAKAAVSGAAKSAVTPPNKTTAQPGNLGTGGRPAAPGQNTAPGTLPPLPVQSTAPDMPPPLPESAAASKTSTASVAPTAAAAGNAVQSKLERPAGTLSQHDRITPERAARMAANRATEKPGAPARPQTRPAAPARPGAGRPAPARAGAARPPARPSRPGPARPGAARPAPGRPVSSRPPAPGRPSSARPAPARGRPVRGDSRPRRPMAPPPGARGGRYVAPASRPAKRGYVVPPAAAATGGSAWGPLLFGILLLGGVLWYAIKHYTPMINADLTTRTNSALAEAGLGDSTSVEIDGRNAILSGTVGSQPDSELAEEVVANTLGVRAVDNQLTVGDTANSAVARVEPSLSFAATDTGVELSGTVSDQAYATKIENTAKEMYGENGVSGSISVDPASTNPGWWPAVQQMTPDLKAINGSFAVADGALVLTGEAPNDAVKTELGNKATGLLNGQLTLDNRISVAEMAPVAAPAPAPLEAGFATFYNSPSRIALYGTMSTDSAAAVEGAFTGATKPVESFIVASETHDTPSWVANFGGSLDAMQDINKGKVKVQPSGDVVISGIATSEDAKQTAANKIAALFPAQSISNKIAVRAPVVAAAPAPAPEPEAAPAPFMKPFATLSDTGTDVKIVGLLPAAALDSITSAFQDAGRTVSTSVTIDERVIQPNWTSAITQSFESLSNLESRKVTVSSTGELSIAGIAANEAARQQAADSSLSVFGNSVSLRNDITVKGPDIRELFAQIDLAAIRFRSNSSELDSDSIGILDQVANALRQSPETTVAITGHTDSTGNDDRNLELSAERAEKVKNFLIDRGIGGDRMTSQGYGSSRPIASNNTVTGRALNRRIEFGLN